MGSGADILFFALKVVITLMVIAVGVHHRRLKRREAGGDTMSRPVDVVALVALAKEELPRIAEYLRSSWNGAAETLPSVLSSLMDQLDKKAREREIFPSRLDLKRTILNSILRLRAVPADVLSKALEKAI
jgi:hypothetical protein